MDDSDSKDSSTSRGEGIFVRIMTRIMIWPILIYRYVISPFTPPACRYLPSCSEYAAQAIGLHGACAGSWLALKRILRCHPWGGSGIDNVPEKHEKHYVSTKPTRPRPRQ